MAPTEYVVNSMNAQMTPVNTVMASIRELTESLKDIVVWGGVSPYQVTPLRPVALMPMPV